MSAHSLVSFFIEITLLDFESEDYNLYNKYYYFGIPLERNKHEYELFC